MFGLREQTFELRKTYVVQRPPAYRPTPMIDKAKMTSRRALTQFAGLESRRSADPRNGAGRNHF
jgi:hypothetical protein